MAEIAEDIATQKAELEAATRADPDDYASQLRLAQLEARIWIQDAAQGDLGTLVRRLDFALANLPAENHPKMLDFVHQLHQRGAALGPVIEAGDHPRLAALLRREPVPQGSLGPGASSPPQPPAAPPPAPAAPPPATPAPAASAPSPARPAGTIHTGAPTGDLSRSAPAPSRTRARAVDASGASNADLKEWIAEGKIEELAAAFQYLDNFRTRRIIIDKVAEPATPLAVACLLQMLDRVDDLKLKGEIRRKISEFDEELLARELRYDPNDHELKLAIVDALAGAGKEFAVEPLTRALNDPDEEVRALALGALSDVLEADEEWMNQLSMMAGRDPSSEVQLAAARALQKIGTIDSMRMLEKARREGSVGEEISELIEDMRGTVGKADRAARKERMALEAANPKKEKVRRETDFDKKVAMKAALAVAGLGIAGYLAYAKVKSNSPAALNEVPSGRYKVVTPEEQAALMAKFSAKKDDSGN